MNKELFAKAKEAKSAEELLALAEENNIEISEKDAKGFFEQINASGELADDELDSVAGGGDCFTSHRPPCPKCGSGAVKEQYTNNMRSYFKGYYCCSCHNIWR